MKAQTQESSEAGPEQTVRVLPRRMRAAGVISLPGSKSISNRALLLAALAEGETTLTGLLDSDDTHVMRVALAKLGVTLTIAGADTLRVSGCGGVFPVKETDCFLGNAGTAMRSLAAVLAFSQGHYRVHGVARMHERPIGDLVSGLRQAGAQISYAGEEGFPPLQIAPAQLRLDQPIRLRGDVSSQFLTGLLLALPLTGEAATLRLETALISQPYVALTLAMMARFGVEVRREDWTHFHIPGGQRYRSPGHFAVESDASSASYFLAAGALAGGAVTVLGLGRRSLQGDVHFANTLTKLGAQVSWGDEQITVAAPDNGRLRAFDLDLNAIPDAAMTLAVCALFADGPSRLRNIASWRVKETDRLSAMATELRKLGATVEEGADYLRIEPPATLTPDALIATYDDHRMAMSFSLASLGARGVPLRIADPGCVAKTFPTYFTCLETVTAPVIAIDGPSASGKGTVARQVAQTLGFHYLESGALYRLAALAAQRTGVAANDSAGLAALAQNLDICFAATRVLLAGEDVTEAIRAEAVGRYASEISACQPLRAALLTRQRAFARAPGLVAEGRDMGTVVFPHAGLKVFLTASAAVRAQRRVAQLRAAMPANGVDIDEETVRQDLEARDLRDAERSTAPLRQAEDALFLDTTDLDAAQAVAWIVQQARDRSLIED